MIDQTRLLYCSPAMRDVHIVLDRLAEMDSRTEGPCNVVIQGETGVGKDLIARDIHERSGRAGRFVAVNCSAVPEALFESELFGHERGAFTGATAKKKGLLEQAEGGTLFLDEVADLPSGLQVKLLRTLQNRTIRHVGGLQDVSVNVRVIAASNRDLATLADDGAFRRDLLHRLDVFSIIVPPLRDREDDLLLLARHFCEEFARKYRVTRKQIGAHALEALRRHSWPGNVRELRHVIEYAYIVCRDDEIRACDVAAKLGTAVDGPPPHHGTEFPTHLGTLEETRGALRRLVSAMPLDIHWSALKDLLREAKALYCERMIEYYGGNKNRAARQLGVDRSSMLRLIGGR